MLSPNIHLERDSSFLAEVWAWYAIGLTVISLRYIVRLRTVGLRGFQGDDYVTFLSLILYTLDAVFVHEVYKMGSNVDVPPTEIHLLTAEDIRILSLGSKLQLAAWYSYTALIWCMKFTLLFFYQRLTLGTLQNKTIVYLFWICGLSYLAVFCTITFGCFPIKNNWAVSPLPSKQCTFKPQNFYVTAILNVITDAIIMVIPIPLLWKLKVSTARKVAIAALLSSGLFVITAAIVRAVLTLGSKPSAININRWGIVETIIGLITVMAPILPPLFRKGFWKRGKYELESHHRPASTWSKTGRSNLGGNYGRGTFELRSTTGSKERDVELQPSNGSQENIIKKNSNDLEHGVVHVHQTYDIRTDDGSDDIEWKGSEGKTGYNTRITAQNN